MQIHIHIRFTKEDEKEAMALAEKVGQEIMAAHKEVESVVLVDAGSGYKVKEVS